MTWAFARDKGLPFWSFIKRVERRTRVPAIAVLVVATCSCLLALIYIGSSTAFNDVVSVTITGFYLSYLVPSAFLLYHRLRGHILPHQAMLNEQADVDRFSPPAAAGEGGGGGESKDTTGIVHEKPKDPQLDEAKKPEFPGTHSSSDYHKQPDEDYDETSEGELIAYAPGQLFWGPWHVPGIWGIINNIYACMYMVFVIFWSTWPPSVPVSAESMNYSVLVAGAIVIFSIFWYIVRGRKEYLGPLVEKRAMELSGLLQVRRERTSVVDVV